MNKNKDNRFGTVETVKMIGVCFERLRYWEYREIVKPKYVRCGTRKFRRYSKEDIEKARIVKMLVDGEKYSLEGAIRKLEKETNG